ncbi:DNA cytosine methyltransferase [Proteus mirabilis]|uniref:DNA cytosine methyltransferase n=1 Tax=Proteus mirabilis TaxID=584 RepID=UPI0018C7579E|nr:DNA cytosine methyltransferase [Proteus mirabilis]HBC5018250.1 DNA cytosine methyltransferase [Proteus mirabilis]HEA4454826.1 DNA cytosine methyltransferase [Proteus mirabilis]HEJ9589585.1 DNA cytosine methyltransferase [Proteus mirabilis]
MKAKVIDLFCGAGGLTHGLEISGLNVIAGIDIASECQFAYESNNNAIFLNKDIAELTSKQVQDLFSDCDIRILAGCAPCQPFSKYTQGLDKKNDKKWPLLYEFQRIIVDILPEVVTMENVPDVTRHSVYDDFYDKLKELGYFVWAETVDCSEFGVPQTRMRHVLLASRIGEIFLEGKNLNKKVTVRETISFLPKINDGEAHSDDELHCTSKLSEINKKRIKASRQGGTWRDWPLELRAKCHTKSSGKGYASVYGRMSWDKPSPTITTLCYGFGNGRFGHPEQDRAISLREAALLQSFPLNYRFHSPTEKIKISHIGRMIGNAVPVKLAECIGLSIRKHLKL